MAATTDTTNSLSLNSAACWPPSRFTPTNNDKRYLLKIVGANLCVRPGQTHRSAPTPIY